jgi:hypothetical protein
MREIRLYGSEGGGAVCSPYPYQSPLTDTEFQLRFSEVTIFRRNEARG